MASIKELPRWEDEVYQIARGDKVEGGVGGIANMQAKTLAERTRYLKNVVESIPDYREFTFYKTENDPEGKLAGIAETHDGQLFRVAQGIDSENSFIYYRNDDGDAVPVAWQPGTELVKILSNLISDQGDNPFSVVFDNGLSPLGYKNGRLYADEFEKLYSSDSGLEFGGSIIDNNPPEGWRFVIYYRNGLVMCGQKDDGTMIGFGEGGSGGGSIEPGDTAPDYDSIRMYSGTATVRDVVGKRAGGRFVVNPDDTTSEEIPGGILVDVLGRRWYRQADFVSYDMFLAPRIPAATLLSVQVALAMGNRSSAIAYLAGVEAADKAIQAAHRFANIMKIPVRQNDGAFLMLVDHEAEVRTNTDLSGAIILTSAN
ncbi:TPA: hypothetical protein ACPUFO_005206, partial [Klebsiella pneumoniae]